MPGNLSGLVLKREALIVIVLLIAGLSLLPMAIWLVGSSVFGAYGGNGFGGFYADLARRLASGSSVAWFLVLSPLLGIVVLRVTLLAFRLADRQESRR